MKSVLAGAAALLLALALPGDADAQQRAKKYVTPDGKVIYSDSPVPGARLEGEVAPPPPPSAPPAATPPARPTRAAGPSAIAQADAEVRAATQQLEELRAKREAAKEPLPGERTGTAGGGSRLNDAYWQRQADLDKAIEAAEQRLKKALDARNAAR